MTVRLQSKQRKGWTGGEESMENNNDWMIDETNKGMRIEVSVIVDRRKGFFSRSQIFPWNLRKGASEPIIIIIFTIIISIIMQTNSLHSKLHSGKWARMFSLRLSLPVPAKGWNDVICIRRWSLEKEDEEWCALDFDPNFGNFINYIHAHNTRGGCICMQNKCDDDHDDLNVVAQIFRKTFLPVGGVLRFTYAGYKSNWCINLKGICYFNGFMCTFSNKYIYIYIYSFTCISIRNMSKISNLGVAG